MKISPPLAPPPSKMVSSLSTARAGPRGFPPPVTDLVIDFDEMDSEIWLSANSAALAGDIKPSSNADTSRDLFATRKTLGIGATVGKLK